MAGTRRDTRGIVEARELLARVRFRRREPAEALRPFLEHYWLIDWDLAEPYATHVVPHPSVNLVFQRYGDEAAWGEVAGVGLELFTQKLEGRGRVCGVQFRPGGFRPFAPGRPAGYWTGRRVPLVEAYADLGPGPGGATGRGGSGSGGQEGRARRCASDLAEAVLAAGDDDGAVAALDAFLLGLAPRLTPGAARAMALVERVRTDRTIRRVSQLAELEGVSARSLQRLFAAHVGVSPKWVVLRYRVHEALERAESAGRAPDWALLAAELGYSDQAHLSRDFTAAVGVPPGAYARRGRGGPAAGPR
jgi:AraC-like DNA-binding protein